MNARDLSGARARHAAATRGPWRWFGNVQRQVCYLATVDRGRIFVLDFVRWGFSKAQPRFQVRQKMVPLAKLEAEGEAHSPIWEVALFGEPRYRDDFQGIAHPDAAFIEHAWADLRDALAALDGLAKAARDVVAHHRTPGDDCYVNALERTLSELGLCGVAL